MISDVHDAVGDLVELIKTYKSKNRLSQMVMSTLFKRRQEEADAVINMAISRLHVSFVCAVLYLLTYGKLTAQLCGCE